MNEWISDTGFSLKDARPRGDSLEIGYASGITKNDKIHSLVNTLRCNMLALSLIDRISEPPAGEKKEKNRYIQWFFFKTNSTTQTTQLRDEYIYATKYPLITIEAREKRLI